MMHETYNIACKKLFDYKAWEEAQREIMILREGPIIDLGFLSNHLDVIQPSEIRALQQQQDKILSPSMEVPPSSAIDGG